MFHIKSSRQPTVILIALLAISAIALAACASPSDTNDADTPSDTTAPEPTSGPLPSRTLEFDLPEAPFDDEEARELMDRLLARNRTAELLAVLDHIVASDDQRFVSVLIEVLRAVQIGILPVSDYEEVVGALQSLSGQDSSIWPDYVIWYASTELEPPPGFTSWKGQLYSRIDSGFEQFFSDEFSSRIRVEEIVWGGVILDGIPALDNPELIPAADEDYLDPSEVVFGVSINGDNRAYPLRIMDWHEMFNDVVGGVPVSLAYCTLCGAGVLYDGRIGDEVYTFGSSGFLMRSNKLMYDRNTHTLWNQLSGEPVLGPLVDSDVRLKVLPVVLTTWNDWQEQHPDTLVLDIDTGVRRPYEPGAAYGEYFASAGTMFPVALRRDLLAEKDRVFAMTIDGFPRAYPTEILTEEIVVNDTLADTNLVLVAPRGNLSASGEDRRSNAIVQWRAGAEVRAFQRGEQTFTIGPDNNSLVDETGATWQITEEALIGPDDETLERLPGHLSYWFGWFNYFPQTSVYGIEE